VGEPATSSSLLRAEPTVATPPSDPDATRPDPPPEGALPEPASLAPAMLPEHGGTLGGTPAPAIPAAPLAPWGPFATFALALAVFVCYAFVQGLPAVFALATDRPPAVTVPGSSGAFPDLPNAGLLFALGTVLAAPLGIAMILGLARARRGDGARFLGLRRPRSRDALLGIGLLALFNLAYDAVSTWLGRPEVPDFMLEAYRTAVSLPVLVLAVVVAAPAFEELLFRGFLLEGLRRSRLGAGGAALASSLLFAAGHLQYDPFDMAAIFSLGLLFAAMRLKSGSTWLTFGLHVLTNLVATVQVAWQLRGE
jgi:CAAX protease family protein